MSFDNLRLRNKALIPLALLALTVCAMLGMTGLQFRSLTASTDDIVSHRDVAAFKLAQAANTIERIPYAVAAVLLTNADTPARLAAQQDFDSAPAVADILLQAAIGAVPDHAAEIARLRDRTKTLSQKIRPVYRAGLDAPGLQQGRLLKPEEQDVLAQAAKGVEGFDGEVRALVADLNGFVTRLIFESARAVQDQRDQNESSLLALGLFGALSALVALGFALWLNIAKVERPLNRLRTQMRGLAGGDLTIVIDEDGRRDEIGEMARAVAVFKTNALERQHAESDAAAARAAADLERAAGSAERARLSQAQTAAMGALGAGLRRLADGNLSVRLTDGFTGEFIAVREDFNAAADKLQSALGLVVRSTGAIRSSSQEIGEASDNLSQRNERQAANLEETAAALEQITNTLRASADNAQHAAHVVANADSDAKKGAVVVRQAVEAMDAIAASSQKIGQIIGVIDEIAFQTNLLALNAGVEAARAGDSGRGFAVVAMEVRALAQRSAGAAKEIKTLVSTSGVQVHSGVKLVAQTGKALESIIKQVSEINQVVGEIAQATQQQATGVAQINSAISLMDQTTQQNATMVQESAAASHALSKETSELTRLVEQFRLAERGDEDLRGNLQSIAPHAFAKPAAPPPRGKSPPAPKLARFSGTDWTEF